MSLGIQDIGWHPPMSPPVDSELMNARIKALKVTVESIGAVLTRHGYDTGSLEDISNKEDKHMDKIAYSTQMYRLNQTLLSANKALADRVKECQSKGYSADQAKDAFWPDVLLPGFSKPSIAYLKDYGRAVDDAFFALMNFLAEVEPVDSLEFLRKRNTLLNDKLISLMELRRTQLHLLSLHDNGPFSLSQWTLFALKEFSEGDPTTGRPPEVTGIPLLRHNSSLIARFERMSE